MLDFGIFIDIKDVSKLKELEYFLAKLRRQFPNMIPHFCRFEWAIADKRGAITMGTLLAANTFWRPSGEYVFSGNRIMELIDDKIDYQFNFRLAYIIMAGSICALARNAA